MNPRLGQVAAMTKALQAFARDSEGWRTEVTELVLDVIYEIGLLHAQLTSCSAPDRFLDNLFPVSVAPELLPVVVASNLVIVRCERLGVAEQLVHSVLQGVEAGDLSVAASAARALVELAADTHADQFALEAEFETLRGTVELRAALTDRDSKFHEIVRRMRYAGRHTFDTGAPVKRNALTSIDKLGDRIRGVYDELSEVCHPNSESIAQYWRVGSRLPDSTFFVPFTPTGGGSSPAKISILNGPWLGCSVVIPFTRTMWWMATIVSAECNLERSAHVVRCGIPTARARNEPCICGSGVKTKACSHPKPPLPPLRSGNSRTRD